MRIDDSVAFVTGGASGLGEGVVRMVTSSGGRAAIFDLPSSKGAALADELGDSAAFYRGRRGRSEAGGAFRGCGAAEHFGKVNLLVNCAGVSPASRTLDRKGNMYPLDVFRRAVDINLIGLFDVVRNTARHMAR